MPTGYAGEGKTYSKRLGRWLKKETHKAFDYEAVDTDSVALLVNFFRWYPDYFADLFRDPNAKYQLELPQRIMMRILMRYRNTYITAVRGATKTYVIILTNMIEGILFPGNKVRYVAPNQKQAAALATQAFHEIEKSYPIITSMWSIRNDRSDMFRIEITATGSEFTMYTTRGDTTGAVVGEECGQEGENPFPIDNFIDIIYPTVRDNLMINQQIDEIHINLKHQHIGNATSRLNKAYSNLRRGCLMDMLYSNDKHEGYVLDMSWVSALVGNIRDIKYIKDQKKQLSALGWQREMCARYTGSGENPLVSDEVLSKSRRLMAMEEYHCGDRDALYIVSHDVSYEDGAKNAKCADVVLKLTRYDNKARRDKFRKQVVYVDSYPPPKTAYLQAQKVKAVWARYCLKNGDPTYLVIDAQAYGREVVEELMKPSEDGSPNLCCYKHMKYAEIEQPNALPIIYPLKAGTRGTQDEDGAMVRYSQIEFEQGNIELLTSASVEGLEQYKLKHNIKDDYMDAKILLPYKKTDELCEQMQNLVVKDRDGLTVKEARRSRGIQRDNWSALKYALRMAKLLEEELVKSTYKAKSSWSDAIEAIKQTGIVPTSAMGQTAPSVSAVGATANNMARSRLALLRRRR